MQAMELSDGGDKSLSQSTFTQHLGRLAGTFANTAFWSSSLFSPLTPTATVLNKHKPSSHSVTLTQSPPTYLAHPITLASHQLLPRHPFQM